MTRDSNTSQTTFAPIGRQRLSLQAELTLALLPTLMVLAVLLVLELFSQQRLLFASLAASACLIYLGPHHRTNRVRTLVIAQLIAAVVGLIVSAALGLGYVAAGAAMAATTALMVTLNVMHPSVTALSFALRNAVERSLMLFLLALALIAVLVLLQRIAAWLLLRLGRKKTAPHR